MELILKSTKRRVPKKIERDFQWYNSYTGEMWRGRGGEMRFRYDPSLRYSVPYLVNSEEWVTESNFSDIEKWVKKKGLEIIQMSKGFSVTVNIEPNQFEDFAHELYVKKIVFDWE